HGIPGRHAFLVAENFRSNVSGIAGPAGSPDRLPRIQPDIFPAVHSWLPRHAAPLLAVSAGVPGAERAFNRRGHDSGGWIRASDGVLPVVDALRKSRAG